MDIVEIVLLVVGGIVFLVSFFLPERKEASGSNIKLAEDEMKKLVSKEFESIKSHVDDVVEEAVTYAIEKTERSLERLSNEKIMAVSEYSDTVLAEIHKNHEEAMFLYDMLNNKQINLKNTVSEINRTVKEAEEKVPSVQKLTPEVLVTQKTEEIPADTAEQAPVNRTSGGRNQSKKNSSKRNSSKKSAANRTNYKANAAGQSVSGTAAGQEWQGTVYGEVTAQQNSSHFQGTGKQSEMQEGKAFQDNNNDKILELYRQGKSAVEIAKKLELGMGEVTLVIDLFKS